MRISDWSSDVCSSDLQAADPDRSPTHAMPFPPPSRRYDDQLFSYDVEMSERLMRMRRAPCLDRGERAADVPLRLGIGMRVNDLAVGRDDIEIGRAHV